MCRECKWGAWSQWKQWVDTLDFVIMEGLSEEVIFKLKNDQKKKEFKNGNEYIRQRKKWVQESSIETVLFVKEIGSN